MNVLVVGGGGREHALVWALRRSPRVARLCCAPGNAGIARLARCLSIQATDISGLLEAAESLHIDLTVVGPEAPLVAGVVDAFRAQGRRIFGPTAAAAAIEGSKAFAKDLMRRHGIPTADYQVFKDAEPARSYVRAADRPLVVKADGLAGGKGAVVCATAAEALAAVDLMMEQKAFGAASARLVVEEYLEGEELSVFALTDGRAVVPLLTAQDHKRLRDGDGGPNTGGMGAYAPVPVVDEMLMRRVMREIVEPTVEAMARDGRPFEGVLYAGLMLTREGPEVLEFNCRFGDPEAQVLMPLLEMDLAELVLAACDRRLDQVRVPAATRVAACVVMASRGYPENVETGTAIAGLDEAESAGALVFHAATAARNGTMVTSGGRVLGVTGVAATLHDALGLAYRGVEQIRFDGMQFRRDIGARALARLAAASLSARGDSL